MSEWTDTEAVTDEEEFDDEVVEEELPTEKQTIRINNITEKLITDEKLSIYELAHIVSTRVMQIEADSKIFVDYAGIDQVQEIAMKELMERKIPLAVRRQTGSKNGEIYMEDLPVKKALV